MYGISCIFQAQVTKFARKMPGKYPLMQAWRLLAGRIAQSRADNSLPAPLIVMYLF